MILEIARILVKTGMEDQFEAGIASAEPIFRRAKGCISMELVRSVEVPNRYSLMIGWETLENHTVDFRGSDDYQSMGGLVANCFEGTPELEHVSTAFKGF